MSYRKRNHIQKKRPQPSWTPPSQEEQRFPVVHRNLVTNEEDWTWITPKILALQLEQISCLEKYKTYVEDLHETQIIDVWSLKIDEEIAVYLKDLFYDKERHILNTIKKFEDKLDENMKEFTPIPFSQDGLDQKEGLQKFYDEMEQNRLRTKFKDVRK